MDQGESTPKKKRRGVRIFFGILLIFVLIAGSFYAFASTQQKRAMVKEMSKWPIVREVVGMFVKKDYETKVMDPCFDEKKTEVKQEVVKHLTGYTNIALFGLDSRFDEFGAGTHSDSIIVVSINNDTNDINLVSVYRDTMLKVLASDGTVKYNKANQGFFLGGPQEAVAMLNRNLDLNITDYAVVNFSGLANIINSLGGIDVKITKGERKYINGYLNETRKITGMQSDNVKEVGMVHLNGLQATAYCRIRYVKFYNEDGTTVSNDMGRTARQRLVLKKLVEKAKAAGVTQMLEIAKTILQSNTETETFIKTSLTYNEVMDLIPAMIDYHVENMIGFPYTYAMPDVKGQSMVVAEGLSYNVSQLHQALFGEVNYQVSQEVQETSDYIRDYTGIQEVQRKDNEIDTKRE